MILDTNALSAFADGSPPLSHVLASAIPAVPVIVLGEYRYGITHSTRKHAYEAWLERYLPVFRVLDVTMQTASEYAVIRSELRRVGKSIPANDIWIAALCRQHDLGLLSRDAHFDMSKACAA